MKSYYVIGRYGASVAWSPNREEAERIAERLNWRGGCIYRVKECTRRAGNA